MTSKGIIFTWDGMSQSAGSDFPTIGGIQQKPKGDLADRDRRVKHQVRAGLVNLSFLSALKITGTILSYTRIDSRRCLWGEIVIKM